MSGWCLVRAWACYHAMMFIEGLLWPLPRGPLKRRLTNAMCRPFFGYGAYWALRSNPSCGQRIRETEKRP